MAEARWPGYQNMISFDSPEVIRARHAYNLEVYGATEDDCKLVDLQEACGLVKKQRYGSTFQLHWTTYKGWKVYMYHTGIMAQIPDFETEEVA